MQFNIVLVKRLMACCGLPLLLSAQDNGAKIAPKLEATDPVQIELDVVAEARKSALRGDESGADGKLSSAGRGEFAAKSSSVQLAQRAVTLCGWLQNDNRYDLAAKVAQRAVAQLAKLSEASDAERAERLYWEGWLEGMALDHKRRAIELLRAAEKLAPEDERVTDLELRLVSAVNAFGR